MTTIITRLFPDQAAAQNAADRLQFKGIPRKQCDVIVAGENADMHMIRAEVHETAIEPYGRKLAAGNAVLVVRTTYKPLGAARLTRDILDKYDTIDAGMVTDDFFVAAKPGKALSILGDHPLILSLPVPAPRGLISDSFGLALLKPHRAKRSVMASSKRISRMFWPMPLVSKRKRSSSVMRGGRHMSRMFWPMPLVSTKPRRKSVIPGGGFPLSRLLDVQTTR